MSEIKAVVLAAGKGTRMMSETNHMPKVLRQACGKPLLYYVLNALDFIPVKNTVLVGGYMKEAVFEAFPEYPNAIQEPQLGTGHAVQCARAHLEGFDGTVLVCYGDMPLLKKEVYQGLLAAHKDNGVSCTMLSGTSEEYLPYGRVIRDENGDFLRIVEERDCDEEQKKIRELNVGIYAFDCKELLACLDLLKNDNAQSEYYLTDVPAIMRSRGKRVAVYTAELNEQILGVNTPEQLLLTERILRGE
ncbi:MAG: NTP transferase domain-containing protein [Clostridia bacterium]|nr:NTP transferase domain-containing protein [Clostridia bacterium]